MAEWRLPMSKIKEILRLHYESSLSHRSITASLEVSRSTVTNVLRRAEAIGLSWPYPRTCRMRSNRSIYYTRRRLGARERLSSQIGITFIRNYTRKALRYSSCGLSIGENIRMDISTANSVNAIASGRGNWMSPCTSNTMVAKRCLWKTQNPLFK